MKIAESAVEEYLRTNPTANPKKVNEAWSTSGHEGSISATLVNKARAELGLTGNMTGRRRGQDGAGGATATRPAAKTRGRKKGSTRVGRGPGVQGNGSHEATAVPKARAGDRRRVLEEVEADIDRLIFKLIAVGGLEDIEHALRGVRRVLVVRAHRP